MSCFSSSAEISSCIHATGASNVFQNGVSTGTGIGVNVFLKNAKNEMRDPMDYLKMFPKESSSYDKTKMSPEEIHRVKQRDQYRQMLNNMERLMKSIPNIPHYDKPKTKQFVLAEAVEYIHYLQLCIYEMGKKIGGNDNEILTKIHWGHTCTDPTLCAERILRGAPDRTAAKSLNESIQMSKKLRAKRDNHHRKRRRKPKNPVKNRDIPRTAVLLPCSPMASPRSFDLNGGCPWTFSPIGPKKNRDLDVDDGVKKENISSTPFKELMSGGKTGKSSHKRTRLDMNGNNQDMMKAVSMKTDSVTPRSARGYQIISPPSSYKRTIIQDSPQEAGVTQNWKQVSVGNGSPWMPKPDNAYGCIEDLAEDIVAAYGDASKVSEEEYGEQFETDSLTMDSYLDSTLSEEDQFVLARLKPEDFSAEDADCAKVSSQSSISTQNDASTILASPDVLRRRSQEFSSPEHLLGFSPRLFLTGARFGCLKEPKC